MSINQQAFLELIDRYLAGTATESEKILVEETFLKMSQDQHSVPLSDAQEQTLKNALFERTLQHISARASMPASAPVRRVYSIRLIQTAAAVLIILSIAAMALFYFNKPVTKRLVHKNTERQSPKDIGPGKEGALLTLADGTVIVLDSMSTGLLSRQQGAEVIKGSNGITYRAQQSGRETAMNTMTTPKGRQYQLTLSDGSKVWLNAGSSITFPTAFTGKERRVAITGEVYFEVSRNKRMPFTVSAAQGQEIQVLGTHFNVNAYENEPVTQTTLLEGSVKVTSGGTSKLIKPGQQAVSPANNNSSIQVAEVDTEEVMAWKEGFFQFDHADLRYLLRQLARWYDLDIVFEGNPDHRMLGGRINRDLPLSAVLKALEAKDIRYRLEGKKLIVL